MDIKHLGLTFIFATMMPLALASGASARETYTNFGPDLTAPIFPLNGTLKIYKAKGDEKPYAELHDLPYYALETTPSAETCLSNPADGWVKCRVKGKAGWVRRSDFLSGAQYQPVKEWPIRYWLIIASTGRPSEETDELLKGVARSPYLSTQKEFANIFFKVQFDREGFAISPKTGKRTGDRVFKVQNAIYLAPADDTRREKENWQFLNFYNNELQAMCPSISKESCYSAANQAADWPGIKMLHTSPPPQYAYSFEKEERDRTPWYGHEEVAFGRFSDPVKPLMYYVPSNVIMATDRDGDEAQRIKNRKNREKAFCIMDCQ